MKKIAVLAAAGAAALTLVACDPSGYSTPSPSHGTVVSKRYTPSRASTTQSCTSTRRSGRTVRTCRPVRSTSPSRYELLVRDGAYSGYVQVDSFTYSRYRIGQRYP